MTAKRLSRASAPAVVALLLIVSVLTLRYAGDSLIVAGNAEHPDAILVLASHEWERLPLAAQLARRYPSARVLLTMPADVTEHNCHECSGRLDWLAREGVDRQRITVLPEGVTNTYDEAKAATTFVDAHGIHRLVVVTSPYHGRRALATFRHLFRRAGVKTSVALASPVVHATPERWWSQPYDRAYVAYEWAGIIYYAFRFGVVPSV